MTVTKASLDKTLRRIDSVTQKVDSVIEEVFEEVGEYVTEGIRDGSLSSWIDDSGKLRSSIGYAVVRKGRVVRMSDFGVVLNGADGARKGKQKVAEIAALYAQYDYLLIIVAGEEYAVYVEAVDGKVVLSEGYIHIEKNLPKQLKDRMKMALRRL